MTDDRAKVDESDFIGIMLEWANGKIEDDSDTLQITQDSKVVATIKIDRIALGLKEPANTSLGDSISPSNGAIATEEA